MSESYRTAARNLLKAAAAVFFVASIAGSGPARAASACVLVPNGPTPSEKILQCSGGEALTVRPAPGPTIGRYTRKATRSRPESGSTTAHSD